MHMHILYVYSCIHMYVLYVCMYIQWSAQYNTCEDKHEKCDTIEAYTIAYTHVWEH